MTEQQLKLTVLKDGQPVSYDFEEPTEAELVELANTLGFTEETYKDEIVGSIEELVKNATSLEFTLANGDTGYDVTHIFKDDPVALLTLIDESDFGKLTFVLESQGAHWFNDCTTLEREMDSIQCGRFVALDALNEYYPELYCALDEACALEYFDEVEFVKKNLDLTLEERWWDGNDYWTIG